MGLVATFVSLVIGVTWGAVAGYKGGTTDNVMMRFVDLLYSLPFMFFVNSPGGVFRRGISSCCSWRWARCNGSR